jgi:gliding-associated putative ABC transporter substrate-binding component GldG
VKDKLKQGVGSATMFVLLLAVLLVLNLISVNLFGRLDLTEGHVYSLSKTSKEVIRNLNDPLIIRMYFTRDLPPPYNGYIRYLKDQLEEYQAYSGGKLKLELIHPDDPKKEMEAQRHGIPPLQVNAMLNDKIEIKKVYMGMVLLFEDRKEVIPVIQNVTDLEYELTSIIKRISYKILPTVGFLIGKDGPELDTDMTMLNQELSRHYQIRKINLDEGDRIPAKTVALIIPGPKKRFSEWEKYGIDQFLMRGGRLAFVLNQIDVNLEQGTVVTQNLEIEDFLANYGVKVNDNLVIDWQCSQVNVAQQRGAYTVSNIINYPFFPTITGFDKNSLIVKDLETVIFNFVSSLDSVEASSKNLRFNPIVWSSDISGIETEPFDINPYRQFTRENFPHSPQILAATIQGSFRSYYADWDQSEIEDQIGFVDTTRTQSRETRLVVIGDADFITDQNLRGNDNLTFFLNIVDWLIRDESLISIRSKQVTTRPLKEISSGARKLIKYGNIFGLPILVIVFGVVRWQLKKKVRRKTEQ